MISVPVYGTPQDEAAVELREKISHLFGCALAAFGCARPPSCASVPPSKFVSVRGLAHQTVDIDNNLAQHAAF
jgi:hypothetical protein